MRLLLIDDNPDDRTLVLRQLRREFPALEAVEVTEARGWEQAIESGAFDLALTDYQLGWSDGLEVLRTLKARLPNCPVVMFTGTGSQEIAVEAMKSGLDDYVIKSPKHYVRLPATIRLVLERSRQRQALRESEDRFKAFMDNSPTLAFLKDEGGRLVYVNYPFERFFNLTRLEWEGKTDFELWPWETARQLIQNDRAVLSANKTIELTETVPAPDGSLHHWLVCKFPVKDRGGRRFLGGIAVNITERERLEEQYRQSQKMESIGLLAGGIAHDFNNLLTVIKGYSGLLLSKVGKEDHLRQDIARIKEAGDRGALLVRQLLAFSRKQVLKLDVLDLNAVIGNIGTLLRRFIGEDIALVTSLEPELGRVKADAGQIEQVIMNLAVNARDSMPEGGQLIIETKNVELDEVYAKTHASVQPGPHVMFAVRDTGCGMDAVTQAHLFEPFFTTKEPGKGSGLGLATVYGIVKQSGGHISAFSGPGNGTTFKIYLPRVEEVAGGTKPAPDDTEIPRGSETVLIVEDEKDVRTLASTILQTQGYTVLQAQNSGEALQIGQAYLGPIHLLLTDMVMPGMNGRELADRLTLALPATRVLYMSGYTDKGIIHHGVLDPGTAFLQKPFTPEDLAFKVRKALDMPRRDERSSAS